jgi:hypothetical protein
VGSNSGDEVTIADFLHAEVVLPSEDHIVIVVIFWRGVSIAHTHMA